MKNKFPGFSNRLESLIKKLKIPKGKLAKSLGVRPGHITNLLKGESNPSETFIMLAGLKYSVNENWLRGIEGRDDEVQFTENKNGNGFHWLHEEAHKKSIIRRPKFMRGICKRAGIRPFCFHSLRHFGATYLASLGVAHKTLSGLLRHRSLATTEIYLQTLDEAQKEAVKQLEGVFTLAGHACGLDEKTAKKAANSAKEDC